jgi:alkylation response protein AidB-like acyl-CoA dehydrogenase
MNLDFSDEQIMLRDQLRRFLKERCPISVVRSALEGNGSFDRVLYKELAGLGVLGAAIPEEFGGVGLGYLELCVLAEELGRSLAPVPVSSSIYLAAQFLMLAGSDEQKSRWLPGIASANIVGTFAMTENPGHAGSAAMRTIAERGTISGVKVPVPDGDIADVAIVAAREHGCGASDEISLFLVDLNGLGVVREVVENIDPTRSQARLVFDGAAAEPLGNAGEGRAIIERVLDQAAVLIAFEQVGGADRSIELARDYALDRMAFGRQIGSFQAIKHMLADMYVSATLARSNAYYGAWALSAEASELPVAAANARVSATQAFQHCAKNSIQVHGGAGFTWEFDCHLYYRRSNALGLAVGSLWTWEDRLIERMVSRERDLAPN